MEMEFSAPRPVLRATADILLITTHWFHDALVSGTHA